MKDFLDNISYGPVTFKRLIDTIELLHMIATWYSIASYFLVSISFIYSAVPL